MAEEPINRSMALTFARELDTKKRIVEPPHEATHKKLAWEVKLKEINASWAVNWINKRRVMDLEQLVCFEKSATGKAKQCWKRFGKTEASN